MSDTNTLSRRAFLAASSAFASSIALGQSPSNSPLTASEVISRIKAHIGVPWMEKTVDNLLTGTPETQVHGIATTMMATLDVVQRCVAQGSNMVITHETPFYLHQDQTADIADDPTLRFKLDFCKKNEVAIFHFHDHWHARHPDGIAQGMVEQLGWQKFVSDPADPKKLTFPATPLAAFARQMQTRLNATTLRVIGDPQLPIRHVQTSWGYISRESGIKIIEQPETDLLICGETREWELVEYVQDSITAGNKKALIVVGHVLSEQGGMILCADWLRDFIKEVPIQFVPSPEPFWNPANPPKN
ncbi:Nif3-like dinuclear metal center hexameric protein [Acidicapsa ligni]|uniref:Nif3-like dinuclear metal center hexameric protein n=1 Tax=Acidicapsa ligni TaxID=542300 RepID=UPI0021E00A31|nr:Nif3-like dinuclear metal center hexameric protein [Acidicapsa ligni]